MYLLNWVPTFSVGLLGDFILRLNEWLSTITSSYLLYLALSWNRPLAHEIPADVKASFRLPSIGRNYS